MVILQQKAIEEAGAAAKAIADQKAATERREAAKARASTQRAKRRSSIYAKDANRPSTGPLPIDPMLQEELQKKALEVCVPWRWMRRVTAECDCCVPGERDQVSCLI